MEFTVEELLKAAIGRLEGHATGAHPWLARKLVETMHQIARERGDDGFIVWLSVAKD